MQEKNKFELRLKLTTSRVSSERFNPCTNETDINWIESFTNS